MSLREFLAQYGYLAVFAGTLLEGEVILVLAGFAAHQGYLQLPVVMLVASLCPEVQSQPNDYGRAIRKNTAPLVPLNGAIT